MAILSPTGGTRLKPLFSTYFHHTNPSPPSISSPFHLHCPFLPPLRPTPNPRRLRRCLAASPGPPQFDPPPQNSSLTEGFSRIKNQAQIFFAVLFWMSLFFWASAFDRSNGGPKKGSRFRR